MIERQEESAKASFDKEEEIREIETAKEAMQTWGKDIEVQFADEIKAKKASVRLSTNEDILELRTKHDYVRIVYNPKDNAEQPFEQSAFHSKDEFLDETNNPAEMPRQVNLSKEATGKFVFYLKDWLKTQNDKNGPAGSATL